MPEIEIIIHFILYMAKNIKSFKAFYPVSEKICETNALFPSSLSVLGKLR